VATKHTTVAKRPEATNGPWFIVDGGAYISDHPVGFGEIVALLDNPANRARIAAVPDLLNALGALLMDDLQDEIEDPHGHADRGQWARINRSVLVQARAAVLKAVEAVKPRAKRGGR